MEPYPEPELLRQENNRTQRHRNLGDLQLRPCKEGPSTLTSCRQYHAYLSLRRRRAAKIFKGLSSITSSSRELGSMTKFATESFSSNPCQLTDEAAGMHQAPTPLENYEICHPRNTLIMVKTAVITQSVLGEIQTGTRSISIIAKRGNSGIQHIVGSKYARASANGKSTACTQQQRRRRNRGSEWGRELSLRLA